MAELPEKITIFLAADGTTGDALHVGVETHGGVLQTVGATCSAVFDTAGSGLRAALEVVRTANRDGADAVLPRIALYSSRAAQEDIAGWAVPPRAMMLMEAAHGGQVLVSARTRELLGDDLPSGVTLRDLGEHRLRDLQHPERIYQVIAPDLPDAFPALNTLDRFRNNLPIQGTGLIGRSGEAAAIREQFAGGARLVTLTGPGGTGKTRLALEAASTLLEYEDGVFFVGLAPVDEPELVGATIAQILGVREAGGQPLTASLQAYLRDKNILLLLDNFEQVTAAAPLIADLLRHAPGLAVLVTSRERLGLSEEHVFDVPPLAVPNPEALPARNGVVAALEQFEAVRLFVERAKMVHPEYALTDANARAVAEICVRLDGLPLAIELAAARVGLLPPQALLSRITRGLHLLAGSAFNLPPRQQTLRGTIAWSYDLLSTEEQQLFRGLGVFAGGFTPAAVTAVCGDPGDGLLSLAAKSLLRREQHGEPRFFMLDTIRLYALERLRQSGEADAIRQHYAAYFLALAEQAEPELTGPQQQHWLDQLALEHNNLRAVLTTLLEQNEGGTALRLAMALWRFWHTRGYLSEGQGWLQSALSKGSDAEPRARAQALFATAALAWAQGTYTSARALAEESLSLRRELNDARGVAASLNVLGLLYQDMGDHHAARAVLEESNALSRQLGDVRGVGVTLLNLGETARALGDSASARTLLEESLQALRAVGDTRYVASALDYLGNVVYEQQDPAGAYALLAESLPLRWAVRDMSGIARTLGGLARVIGTQDADALRAVRAARLLGAAEAVRATIGAPVPTADRPRYERDLERIRSHLEPDVFEAALAEGRSMPLEQAIAEAQQTPVFAGSTRE